MSVERGNWWMYMNPCGGRPVKGFELKRCFPTCEQTKACCLSSGAFQMAGYLLKGSSIDIERHDYRNTLYIGQAVIDLDGNLVKLTPENINPLLETVVNRAQALVNALSQCAEHTLPITQDYLDKCNDEQSETLKKILKLSEQAGHFRSSKEQAQQLIEEMRGTLERAIDLGLDELGLVTRQAIAYGLGEQVLAKRGISVDLIPTKLGRLQRVY